MAPMAAIVLAILPVFLLIVLGALIRRRGLLAEGFWAPAERLTYVVLLPALLIVTLASADLGGLEVGPMALATAAPLLLVTGVLLLFRPLLGIDGPALASLIQGVTRMNTYIGLSVAVAVQGGAGLDAAAVAVAVIVPLGNLLGVGALARLGTPGRSPRAAAALVLRNPLIIACAVGIGLNLSGFGLPPVIRPLLEMLGRGALPLGLLAVGAGLDLGAVGAGGRSLFAALGLKLLVLPALTAAACAVLAVSPVAAFVAILFNATPASPVAFILARQLGGDARLMAGIIAAQTACALVTLPLVLIYLA